MEYYLRGGGRLNFVGSIIEWFHRSSHHGNQHFEICCNLYISYQLLSPANEFDRPQIITEA